MEEIETTMHGVAGRRKYGKKISYVQNVISYLEGEGVLATIGHFTEQGEAMYWNRRRAGLAAALLAAACATGPSAVADERDMLPAALAREVAQRTIELTETKAVPPRDPAQYAQAKRMLLETLDKHPGGLPRAQLHGAIMAMLATLDSSDHSFVWTPVQRAHFQAGNPVQAAHQTAFAAVATPNGQVLHWSPPAVTANGVQAENEYVKRFLAEAGANPGLAKSCGLVVDLRGQTGGNAWPVMFAMQPLFNETNVTAFVERTGARHPVLQYPYITKRWIEAADGKANPLSRFAGLPVAVVLGNSTSSAGEMIALALLGEGERIRTFGWATDGRTTANQTYSLPDGSLLLLTQANYAVGDKAIRGKLLPQQAAQAGDSPASVIAQAAAWAAAQSPLCVRQGQRPSQGI
jgi:hypothetical protein